MVKHVLWQSRIAKAERDNMTMKTADWTKGRKDMERIIKYVKKIGLHNGI
jgi:hypothetical protein